jgi:RNA-directed DNA polymerase
MLKDCFRRLRKDAAPGVDDVSYEEYEKHLDANVAHLVQQLKHQSYRARLVRRKHIPKGQGKLRPLGIPTLEDKLLQLAVALILSAIYEADFLPCSYGYRPGRGPHDAVTALTDTLFRGYYEFVVEADIRGYFEHIQHDWLVRMLEERIADAALVGLIRKWLRAGILMEDGRIEHPETGTPQGGSVSPVLANVYLHYVLDLWFERRVKKSNRGACELFRFADDFVCAFAYRHEAEAFERALKERLEKFGLEVAPEKTKTLRFGRGGGGYNQRFDFLGFEFRWENSRAGKPIVKRRTARKKLRAAVTRFTEWIKTHRHRKLRELMMTVAAKHRGHWNYYGLSGNSKSLSQFRTLTCEILFKWLNRRSQRRSLTWRAFNRLLKRHQVPLPRIREQAQTADRGGGSPGESASGGDWAQFLQEMWRTARA